MRKERKKEKKAQNEIQLCKKGGENMSSGNTKVEEEEEKGDDDGSNRKGLWGEMRQLPFLQKNLNLKKKKPPEYFLHKNAEAHLALALAISISASICILPTTYLRIYFCILIIYLLKLK